MMYDQTSQVYRQRKSPRFSASSPGRGSREKQTRGQERTRILQLLVCFVLFLVVFIGKGVFPSKLVQIRSNVLSLISSNTDFQGAFSQLGESLSGEGTVFGELGEFCVEVFGGGKSTSNDDSSQSMPEMTSLYEKEREFLGESSGQAALANHFLHQNDPILPLTQSKIEAPVAEEPDPQPVTQPEQVPAVIPAAGTVVLKSDYSGQPLPNNYTMDQLSLGELETITPVIGHIRSDYGYRDHPINGKYQFHGGVDIGGQTGDPIKSFAAGTVEYIGKDNSYGLYVQIDHGNGVKSFYAHCRTICVSKGQSVALGEKIAEVGSSGAATGPHLHLELKYNSQHLNPIYYVEYLTDQ